MKFKFENLEIWKLSRQFVSEIYTVTRHFPKDEMFGLISQIRRAAVSIALNIVEGSDRGSDAEFKRFLNIAKSSLDEVLTGLFIARDQGFISDGELERFYKLSNTLASKIKALSRRLA